MCGINGSINFLAKKDVKKIISSMNQCLFHRGPDGKGIFVSKNKKAVLGHRRLSIVDVAGSPQPMETEKNGAEYAITFNGEIYNYKELKEKLEKRGYTFNTNGDTEVLLLSYIEFGEKCVDELVGEFAFAIYDGEKDLVFLARDRTGVKPLYYTLMKDGSFIFSSEPKGILGYPGFRKEPDYETIADYFLGMLTFAAGNAALDKSFFKNIFALNPGYYAIFSKDRLITKQYWDIPINDKKIENKDYVPLIKKEFTKTTLLMLPDEVKFGTALSGGLDSSIITSLAAKKIRGTLTSSTIRFKGDTKNSDDEHAQIVAKRYGINLLTTDLTAEKMISDIDFMIKAMDEPHDSIRQLGMIANYRKLHEAGCKVVLTGEGADEFNLGYYHKFPGLKLDKDECSTSKRFRKLWRKRVPYVSQYFNKKFLSNVNFEKVIDYNVSNYYDKCKSKDSVKRMQYFYGKKFLKFLQDANDRCAMANSVEARLPFCNHNVVELALEVPPEINLKNNSEKFVLRQAFKDILPKEIFERAKSPLPANEDMKLHKLISKELDKNIKKADPKIWKILSKKYIINLNNSFKNRINELEEKFGKGRGAEHLTAWLPISQDVEIRTNHVFSVLTFMRWYKMNFS